MKELEVLLGLVNEYRPEVVFGGLSVVVGLIYLLGKRFSDQAGTRG